MLYTTVIGGAINEAKNEQLETLDLDNFEKYVASLWEFWSIRLNLKRTWKEHKTTDEESAYFLTVIPAHALADKTFILPNMGVKTLVFNDLKDVIRFVNKPTNEVSDQVSNQVSNQVNDPAILSYAFIISVTYIIGLIVVLL